LTERVPAAAEPAPEGTEPGPEETEPVEAAPVVVVLADDLIWATRLVDALTAAGAIPRRARRVEDLTALLEAGGGPGLAVIDLTARAYDGVAAIQLAAHSGARVVAVGQHDDVDLRKRAIAAGAERVFTYRALFEDGPRALGSWLAR
jgi:ActR/RegA family two-component response regulator